MKLNPNDLLHFAPSNGIALIYKNSEVCALEPPFDPEVTYPVSVEPNEKKRPISFADKESLQLYLEFKNWLYVSHSTRVFLLRTSMRPELVKGPKDLAEFIMKFFDEKSQVDKLSPHLPLAIQIYRTMFGDKLSTGDLEDRYPGMLSNEKAPEIAAKIRIMSKIKAFDQQKWAIPALHEIESRWLPEERFDEITNWTIFMDKYSGLDLSEEARENIRKIFAISKKEAKRLKFIQEGRHKIKEWQKGAPIHR